VVSGMVVAGSVTGDECVNMIMRAGADVLLCRLEQGGRRWNVFDLPGT